MLPRSLNWTKLGIALFTQTIFRVIFLTWLDISISWTGYKGTHYVAVYSYVQSIGHSLFHKSLIIPKLGSISSPNYFKKIKVQIEKSWKIVFIWHKSKPLEHKEIIVGFNFNLCNNVVSLFFHSMIPTIVICQPWVKVAVDINQAMFCLTNHG